MKNYDDIINLPHHVSAKHPQMPQRNRAAQFAPFAALTGHNEAIVETARLTEDRHELSDSLLWELDEKLKEIYSQKKGKCVKVIYFRPDKKKQGGKYVEHAGIPKAFDEYERAIIFEDGMEISVDMIQEIEVL